MNEYLLWFWITVIAVFVIGIGSLLIKKILQDRDAKSQLEGKETFREFEGEHIPDRQEEQFNNDFEIEKNRMRSSNMPPL